MKSISDANEQIIRLLTDSPPVVAFNKTSETNLTLTILADDKNFHFNFQIGQEQEMEKRDGSKVLYFKCLRSIFILFPFLYE